MSGVTTCSGALTGSAAVGTEPVGGRTAGAIVMAAYAEVKAGLLDANESSNDEEVVGSKEDGQVLSSKDSSRKVFYRPSFGSSACCSANFARVLLRRLTLSTPTLQGLPHLDMLNSRSRSHHSQPHDNTANNHSLKRPYQTTCNAVIRIDASCPASACPCSQSHILQTPTHPHRPRRWASCAIHLPSTPSPTKRAAY